MLWFTSDTHFGHKNIIKYCNRPFEHKDAMDEKLVENWNSYIQPDDEVWHLGDVAFMQPSRLRGILSRLNGNKNLIIGNHDGKLLKDDGCRQFFSSIQHYKEIEFYDEEIGDKQKVVLFHFPIDSWHHKNRGAIHLHGHCHDTVPAREGQARLDVGVDTAGRILGPYRPFSWEDIKQYFTIKMLKKGM